MIAWMTSRVLAALMHHAWSTTTGMHGVPLPVLLCMDDFSSSSCGMLMHPACALPEGTASGVPADMRHVAAQG